jgi:hypothetical protein
MLRFRRAAVAMALVLAVVAGCGAASPSGSSVATTSFPAPGLSGTPGHFDDGQVSFDYPTDWQALGGGQSDSSHVEYVFAVLGNGTWRENCPSGTDGSMSWMNCRADNVEVPPGGIVVKVYRWWRGPLVLCRGDTQANATLGSNAVDTWTSGAATSWEIRMPGGEFGWPNNPTFEVHTADPAQFARAEAVVASLRWNPGEVGYGSPCSPAPN